MSDFSGQISFRKFVDVYLEDKRSFLKERTMKNKECMIYGHIIPFFGDLTLSEITPADIVAWQKYILGFSFSESYQRLLQNQLSAIFTHAVRFYGLKQSPCHGVPYLGRKNIRSLRFWTLEEYELFLGGLEKGSMYYLMFEMLFWTGIREGELLALTDEDIDLDSETMYITKTYYRSKGKDIITSPKTEDSVRRIIIPNFLCSELRVYTHRTGVGRRLFPITAEALQHKMKRVIKKTGVEPIRVHDLRHSHAAFLINRGCEPLLIKERLGHSDIRITMNTYGHLYPSRQREITRMLEVEHGRLA